jgi:hypothetical protein
MDPAPVILLIFMLVALATVAISLVVQQYSSRRSTYLGNPDQPRDLGPRNGPGESHLTEDTDEDMADPADNGLAIRELERRAARAEELEAIARRERQYAERAEEEARRLRDWDGPAPTERQARRRRAGVAPEDLDY